MTSASDEQKAPADVTSGGARSPPSDTDERPVRKQLKETSIDSSNDKGSAASAPDQGSGRKRSFEETRGNTDDTIENGDGPRKRSRECTPEDAKKENSAAVPVPHNDPKTHNTTDAMNEDDAKALKKKRSLEQLEEEGAKKLEETEKKRHRDNSQERETQTANVFAQSAFATAAASSPFAMLGGSSSTSTTEKPASTSAFASSALSSFAGSEKSPFGSFGSSKPSVFKSGSGMSGFGSSSTSGFGSLKSGFAGVGGGFAAAGKSGGLTNFASPNAPATLGGEPKPAKPIRADESGDEGSDNDEGEETSAFEADKTDERFYEQTIETGEEEEENLFACKGKLFHFGSGEWKERGVGTFKINARKSDDGKQHGRMIMRADGALRVMLNSPVFKGMTFGDAKNQEPTSKQIFLASNEEGRTVPLLLRVGNEALAKDLYVVIKDLLDGE
ncbi:uncharacterized protein N7473_005801 [Penicillium subrubescens]|uniref:uncharacterized protein n=1 Tax=Penicillium subrubescens TaxID=1316194 RepID=UPI00254576F7|nr:uncharacterized protein N7473_005801 [Penicillium subrubescens]KAJ5896402.1 hypothetical protein N7473_005801 [Penicillium subrubescens]